MKKVILIPKAVLRPVRNYLSSMQKRLERRKRRLAKEDPFLDSSRVNDNAASDADAYEISGHDRIEALKQEVDKRLINVRKTLTKIKLGKYGMCENCSNMIDTDRLAANPTAELCMNCMNDKKK
jgi:DnaK suppressor protein